jgi:hypothetical protein
VKTLALAFVVALGLIIFGALTTAAVPLTLLIGWAPYLGRVLPHVTANAATIAVGAAAIVLFLAGVQWFGRTATHRWRWRWSLAAVGGVVVLFAAGICLIGMVHQTGWLLSSPEPALVEIERFRWSGGGGSSEMGLRQTLLGFHNAHSERGDTWSRIKSVDGIPLHNWVTPALPYIGYASPIDLEAPWYSPQNCPFFRAPVNVLINPSLQSAPFRDADGYGLAHYAANCRVMKDGGFRPLKELNNGTSNTPLIGEVNANFEPWGKPGNCRDPLRGIGKSAYGFAGPPGAGGALFGFADGSVRLIRDDVSPDVLKAMTSNAYLAPGQ